MNIVDACNLLNIEMDENWKGASGEDTAKAIIGSFPIFRVVFMGEKYPITDFYDIKQLAYEQGLSAIVLDALDNTQNGFYKDTIPLQLKLEWIGEVIQNENTFSSYKKAICSLSDFYSKQGFQVMILKGYACSINWPRPSHRPCGDIDIWLFGKQKEADAMAH